MTSSKKIVAAAASLFLLAVAACTGGTSSDAGDGGPVCAGPAPECFDQCQQLPGSAFCQDGVEGQTGPVWLCTHTDPEGCTDCRGTFHGSNCVGQTPFDCSSVVCTDAGPPPPSTDFDASPDAADDAAFDGGTD